MWQEKSGFFSLKVKTIIEILPGTHAHDRCMDGWMDIYLQIFY